MTYVSEYGVNGLVWFTLFAILYLPRKMAVIKPPTRHTEYLELHNYMSNLTSTHWPIHILFFKSLESELVSLIGREDNRLISEIGCWHSIILHINTPIFRKTL